MLCRDPLGSAVFNSQRTPRSGKEGHWQYCQGHITSSDSGVQLVLIISSGRVEVPGAIKRTIAVRLREDALCENLEAKPEN